MTALLVTGVLLLPYLTLPRMVRSFDILNELPASTESRQGFAILKAHFNEGELMPVTIVLTDGHDLQAPDGLSRLAAIHAALAQVDGVAQVRSVVHPTGGEQPDLEKQLLAAEQLRALTQGLQQATTHLDPAQLSQSQADPNAALQPIADYLDELGQAFPQVAQDPAYTAAQQTLADLRTHMAQALEQLQVSTQLHLLSGQLAQLAPSSQAASAEQAAQGLHLIQAYLDELAQAYPEARETDGYQQATQALKALLQAQQAAQHMNQAGAQLAFLAQQMQALGKALQAPQPSAPGQTDPQQQLALLDAYLKELGTAYPEVQHQPAFTDATQRIRTLGTVLAQREQIQTSGVQPDPQRVQQILTQIQHEGQGLTQDLQTLAAFFADKDAPLASQALAQSPWAQQQQAAMQQTLADLRAGLDALSQHFAGRDARLFPKSLQPLLAQQGTNPQAQIQAGVERLTQALSRLADRMPPDAYFLPPTLVRQQPEAGKLLDTFLSHDRTAAQIQVLLKGDPYGEAALETIRRLEQTATQAAQAQGLQAYVTGPTVQIYDIRTMVNQDFPRVMAVVSLGVWLVFVFLLGSLVAPFYLVATVLLSYGTTMGLVTVLFQDLLGQAGVNYAIPIVIFTLLVALGADYNIFLTSRIWEEAEKRGDVREGVRYASAYTGGVITSAGIILAGTFGALMFSTLQSQFQIGAAVALGVLVDTFIVRSALVPALAALVGRLNWWPAKHPVGHGGLFRLLAERLRKE